MNKKLTVHPESSLHGIIGPGGHCTLPGDKSLSHRAALFAALADGNSRIENFLVSGVTEAMLNALTALGVPWQLDGSTLDVQGNGIRGLQNPREAIHCGNSATTLRLLVGALVAAGVAAELVGSAGLTKRPMTRVVEPLQMMGAPIHASPTGTAPIGLQARRADAPLKSIDYTLPVASAQVKSAIILAGLAAQGVTTLREPGPSRDHTERMLRSMGVEIDATVDPDGLYVTRVGVQRELPFSSITLRPLSLRLPCDISSAAFLIVAALITPGSEIIIQGVGLNPTRTGLLEALRTMGADLSILPGPEQGGEPYGNLVVRHSSLHGAEIAGDLVVRMIDEFPVFAVAAAYAQGVTVVHDAQELRYKESDRISALCGELRRLGAWVDEQPDGFIMHGGQPLTGGTIDPHGDHRLAMALAVAGLAAEMPVQVEGAEIIGESFPEFVPILTDLGAQFS